MDEVEVSTVVYLPPEEVYDFLADFPRYARYSEHLRDVAVEGDGSPGTRYDMTFAWWKLTYTARSEVTGTDPPHRIDWRIIKDVDAEGYWQVEPEPEAAPPGTEHASRVRMGVQFWPDSADDGLVDLPRFVSLDRVVEAVKPKVQEEAERVVQRIVSDLEGDERPVELTVHSAPG
ncbi:MAG: type II toxin-antitoxin system RatA family toxin [Halorientalis sp.]